MRPDLLDLQDGASNEAVRTSLPAQLLAIHRRPYRNGLTRRRRGGALVVSLFDVLEVVELVNQLIDFVADLGAQTLDIERIGEVKWLPFLVG